MKVREVKSFNDANTPGIIGIGIGLSGDAQVSTTNYGGIATNITIHALEWDDILRLITELTDILNDMR